MKLPVNYFENLTTAKYREYLKLLPNMQSDNAGKIFTLILTFAALSFFGIFAINPTVSTIVQLKKELADNMLVKKELDKKISNLSMLQQKYNEISPDFPFVYNALPENAQVPMLGAQIESLAHTYNLHIVTFQIFEVQAMMNKQTLPNGSSFVFSLEANGKYDAMINFMTMLTKGTRVVTIETVSLSKNEKNDSLVLNLRGRAYYAK
jgi:Tfp pilus assembly protein PilO